MSRLLFLIAAVAVFLLATVFYRAVNRGLSSSARHQQLTRLGITSIIAFLPLVICDPVLQGWQMATAITISIALAVSYPLIYHLSNRKVSPDYDNYMDIVLGIYTFSILTSLITAGRYPGLQIPIALILSAADTAILLNVIFQWGYYILYGNAIDIRGMKIFYETHYNEVIEFGRSFNPVKLAIFILALLGVIGALFFLNISPAINSPTDPDLWKMPVALVSVATITYLTFHGRRSPWRRSGLTDLYMTVKDYSESNRRYLSGQRQRLAALDVTPLGKRPAKPSTILLVIGESASRDFMSAFTPLDRETTPWLSEMKRSGDFILYPHAYSCAMHTVESLERALTMRNQYNDAPFLGSPSVVDIAHKLGYRVHWYSNQGHLGANDTPVTLIAETSDVAKWTKQQLNKVQYDESLLDFLDELDPAVNNLLVVHLKGSHFNFLNRYPPERTVWGTPGVQDNEINYMNSIRYTDDFLRQLFDRCRRDLNLRAMVYFSDHATIPSRNRTPNFDGFGHVRIPLAVYLSEEYRADHPDRANALSENRNRYFTNDLIFELMCGIFDIRSSVFDETASLASPLYRFTPDDLTTFNATVAISDDPDIEK